MGAELEERNPATYSRTFSKNKTAQAMGLVRITSWYPNFNGSHFGLPPSKIHRMTGLPPKILRTMTYSHRPHWQKFLNFEAIPMLGFIRARCSLPYRMWHRTLRCIMCATFIIFFFVQISDGTRSKVIGRKLWWYAFFTIPWLSMAFWYGLSEPNASLKRA